MNKLELEGKWEQLKGLVKEKWGRLTDDDVALVQGHTQQFYGKMKEKYGMSQDEAEKNLKDLKTSCNCSELDQAA